MLATNQSNYYRSRSSKMIILKHCFSHFMPYNISSSSSSSTNFITCCNTETYTYRHASTSNSATMFTVHQQTRLIRPLINRNERTHDINNLDSLVTWSRDDFLIVKLNTQHCRVVTSVVTCTVKQHQSSIINSTDFITYHNCVTVSSLRCINQCNLRIIK